MTPIASGFTPNLMIALLRHYAAGLGFAFRSTLRHYKNCAVRIAGYGLAMCVTTEYKSVLKKQPKLLF